MVRSNICPRCLKELKGWYVEEGHIIISSEPLTCPHCGFSLLGAIDDDGLEVEDQERLQEK